MTENSVYVMELVQCCHKILTVVLKLDFAKAFDTVNRISLFKILQARGFNDKWIGWVHQLLSTSKTSVLVNGCMAYGFLARERCDGAW